MRAEITSDGESVPTAASFSVARAWARVSPPGGGSSKGATDPFAGDDEDAGGDAAKAGTEGTGAGPGFEASPNPTTRPRTRLTMTTVGMSGGIGTDRPRVRGRRSVVRVPSGSSWRSPIPWSPLERD